jgi:hypothetical protein
MLSVRAAMSVDNKDNNDNNIHKLRNLIFPLKRYVIYGCLLNHHKQSKLINCNVIPLYLVSFAVILKLKLCLKYFIRNIHGYIHYPTYWIYPWISMDMDIHCRVLFVITKPAKSQLLRQMENLNFYLLIVD